MLDLMKAIKKRSLYNKEGKNFWISTKKKPFIAFNNNKSLKQVKGMASPKSDNVQNTYISKDCLAKAVCTGQLCKTADQLICFTYLNWVFNLLCSINLKFQFVII